MSTPAETFPYGAPKGWKPDDSSFGARLALVRQHMGWGNVKEAAMACGLPVGSWRNWERDGRAPRDLFNVSVAISTVTGCDFLWLTGYEIAARNIVNKASDDPTQTEMLPRLDLNQQPCD